MKRGAAATRQAARRRQDDRALFNVKATNWTVSPLQARGVTRVRYDAPDGVPVMHQQRCHSSPRNAFLQESTVSPAPPPPPVHRGLKCSPAERRGFGRGSARGPRDPALSAPNGSAR
ncbi:unnamed protein product [Lota lota]